MQEVKEIFDTYGVDYEMTMSRFMYNEDMYLKFLNMLFDDKNLEKLANAIEEGNIAEAFEAAHTLKGVVGNMGLTRLFNAVNKIAEPLRAGEQTDNYPELYQAIQMEFEKVNEFRQKLGRRRQG